MGVHCDRLENGAESSPPMQELLGAFQAAFSLVRTMDPDLVEIVALSVEVTGVSLLLACLVGLPLGGALALFRFPGRALVSVLLNASIAVQSPCFFGHNRSDIAR